MTTNTLIDRDFNTATFAAADFKQRGHQEQTTALGLTDQRFIVALNSVVEHGAAINQGKSTTSLTIGTGSKSLSAEATLEKRAWFVGAWARIEDNGNSSNFMEGEITAYNDSDGSTTVDVKETGGSGTISDWVVRSMGKKGNKGDKGDPGSSSFDWITKSSAYTASKDDRILADTSGSAFTITLPSSPSTGDQVAFGDSARNFATNNLTVDGNGNNILGASTFTVDVDDFAFILVYNGTQWVFGGRP